MNLQHFLQREELKYTLNFEVHKLKQAMGDEEILQYVTQIDHTSLSK